MNYSAGRLRFQMEWADFIGVGAMPGDSESEPAENGTGGEKARYGAV